MNRKFGAGIQILAAAVVIGLVAAAWLGWAPGRAPTGPPEKLTIAVPRYIGGSAILVAHSMGYFKQQNLDVELQMHSSGRAALDSLLDGKADLAVAADTPVVFAATSGRRLLIVATLASQIRDQGIVARRDHGIAALADLRGKRIGVTTGTSAHYCLDATLLDQKIAASAVTIVGLKPEELAPALAGGTVDAVATWNPYLESSLRAVHDHGAEFSGAIACAYTFNLAARPDLVKAKPVLIEKALRALAEADSYMKEHPAAAQQLVANAIGADAAWVAREWSNYPLRLALEQTLLRRLEDESRWVSRVGAAQGPAVPDFLDYVYVDALAAVSPKSVTVIR